jgi:hypothetical protein
MERVLDWEGNALLNVKQLTSTLPHSDARFCIARRLAARLSAYIASPYAAGTCLALATALVLSTRATLTAIAGPERRGRRPHERGRQSRRAGLSRRPSRRTLPNRSLPSAIGSEIEY